MQKIYTTLSSILILLLFSASVLLPSTLMAANAKPITLKFNHESMILPAPAQRIVVLEFSLLDDLLQLGVKPIAIATSRIDEGTNPPFLLDQIKNMTDVGIRQQPNLEKIKILHPDLIVADVTMHSHLLPLLKQIAPTLLLNGLQGDPHTQINNLRILAEATNTQNKVARLSAQLMTAYARAKKLAAGTHERIMIGYISNAGQFQALTANALTSKILRDFGRDNVVTVSRKEQSTPLPIETMLAQDPDSIIILLTDGDLTPFQTLSKQNPLWKELRAVKTKHIYFMDRDIWAKNHGFLATKLLLKEAEKTGFLTHTARERNQRVSSASFT